MKIKKMRQNIAGSYVPREFADEIMQTLEAYDLEPEFLEGAACVLSYLSCPEDNKLHGSEFPKFLDCGLAAMEEGPSAEALSQARAIIEMLKAHGVNVVEATIVRRGDL